jgi:hypothetical protein
MSENPSDDSSGDDATSQSSEAGQGVPASVPSTGSNWKVLGENQASDGTGVLGMVTSGSGETRGVYGVTDSLTSGAAGLRGDARAGTGEVYGVYGTSSSSTDEAAGVYGRADATSGYVSGVLGETVSQDPQAAAVRGNGAQAVGVRGDSTGNMAVYGRNSGTSKAAVRGYNSSISGATTGVYGSTLSTADYTRAVRGVAAGDAGQTYGVHGETESSGTGAAGVLGYASAGTGQTYGVKGIVDTTDEGAAAVYADAGGDAEAIRAAGTVRITDDIDNQLAAEEDYYPLFVENSSADTGNLVLGLQTGYTGNPQTGHNFVQFLSASGGGSKDFNGTIQGDGSGGVTYKTSGADYAEFLPRRDPDEVLEPGDVVGVFDGSVSRRTEGAAQVLVVSEAPIVAGNAPDPGAADGHEQVAFVGQVDVSVRGPVEAGDLIVPSGEEDGTGRAVSPGDWTPDADPVVGRAWEGSDEDGVSQVTVAVGIEPTGHVTAALEGQGERLDELARENERLRAALDAKDERIDRLESELATVEAAAERTREESAELRGALSGLAERVSALEGERSVPAPADD